MPILNKERNKIPANIKKFRQFSELFLCIEHPPDKPAFGTTLAVPVPEAEAVPSALLKLALRLVVPRDWVVATTDKFTAEALGIFVIVQVAVVPEPVQKTELELAKTRSKACESPAASSAD